MRFLQKHVETLSAKRILAVKVQGGDTIWIAVKEDALAAEVRSGKEKVE